jgi:bifunctional DNA-binding transcriptional regulator/antitoxin component of YhaV-PrlF toxin-antitoxin module
MPLTKKVEFRVKLEIGNRFQIPKLVRNQFKIETDQTLKVGAKTRTITTNSLIFYAKMDRQGRIHIPKTIRDAIKLQSGSNWPELLYQITLEPA